MKIHEIVRLSDLLAGMDTVKRATKLPSGGFESDSHHSLSLALICFQIVKDECPELDINKVVLFALVHDLLEIVTGDVDTLHFTAEQHASKFEQEQAAFKEFEALFADYPDIKQALHEYEKLDTPEAATVFVLDKACTTWTHHADKALYAKQVRGLHRKSDIDAWSERQRRKFEQRLTVPPPEAILKLYDDSFAELKALFDE